MSNKPAWQEMGLTAEEYEEIKKIMGREPNYTEIGIFAVMWSEHASYKNSRPVLKNFPTTGKRVLQGPGENAGIVDIGDNQSVVFKVESHNHPSALEPYQGAATGIGGIIRDIFTMGARPIACLNSLRFGELKDNPKVKWLFEEVVAGIAGYGNCIGIPTVAGEVYFDDSYEGNPLVNAMCVGLVDNDKIAKGTAAGAGNAVMVVGARTGRDGIHGATFASEDLTEESEEKRSAVQVGDPFMEKLLLEACLELIKTGYLVGIQDMGAAGLTCSTTEMAGRGDSGMEIDVSMVPVREEGMSPYEIMLSESQERMLAVPHKGKEEEVRKIFAKWGLNAVVIGHVTEDGLLTVKEKGEVVAQVPIKALTDDAPTYIREEEEPAYLKEVQNYSFEKLPMPTDYSKVLTELLSFPNIASKEWVYRQYDHQVMTNTVVKPGSDAAVMRVKGTKKGLAMTIDCNARYCYLNPSEGGKIAVAEAARNLVCSGAEPLAVTDCLNYGNPYKPEVFWTFHKSIDGMAEACRQLDTPVIGGNVSFYNETRKSAVYPTPTIGMVGLVEDVDSQTTTQGFKEKGDIIILLGENKNELGGSEYLKIIHGESVGNCPQIDLDYEARVQKVCLTAIKEGLLQSAHDCSEGGLAVALAECCISGKLGARVNVDADFRTDALLFGETQSRIIVSLKKEKVARLAAIAKENNVPTTVLGMVEEDNLDIMANDEMISVPVFMMEKLWRRSIECAME